MKDKTVLVELKTNDITLQGLKNVPRITIGSNLDRCKRVEQNYKNSNLEIWAVYHYF